MKSSIKTGIVFLFFLSVFLSKGTFAQSIIELDNCTEDSEKSEPSVCTLKIPNNTVSIGEIRQQVFTGIDNQKWFEDMGRAGIASADADNVQVSYNIQKNIIHVADSVEGMNELGMNIDKVSLTREQLFYIGANIGFIFPYGAKVMYVDRTTDQPYYHAEVQATSSDLIHSIAVGGGYHPWGKNFYLGMKLKEVILYDVSSGVSGIFDSKQNVMAFGVTPNLGWQFGITKNRRVIGVVEVGMNKSFGSEFSLPPQVDLQFGIAVQISKKIQKKHTY